MNCRLRIEDGSGPEAVDGPLPGSGRVGFGFAGLFPCSAGRPFPRPGLRSGTGVARRGGQGRAQARPTGLVLDGPERGARLLRSWDDAIPRSGQSVRAKEHGAGPIGIFVHAHLRLDEVRAQAAFGQLQALAVPGHRFVGGHRPLLDDAEDLAPRLVRSATKAEPSCSGATAKRALCSAM